MFKATFFSCFCLAALTSAFAGVHTEMYFKDPEHPGKCKIENHILIPGQIIKHPLMECAQFTCNNTEGLARIESCDPVHALPANLSVIRDNPDNPPTCRWAEYSDTSKPYPECCHRNIACAFFLRKK